MISLPLAHVAGIPIEETLGSLGPALLVAVGAAWTNLRARLRRVRLTPTRTRPPIRQDPRGVMMRPQSTTLESRDADS